MLVLHALTVRDEYEGEATWLETCSPYVCAVCLLAALQGARYRMAFRTKDCYECWGASERPFAVVYLQRGPHAVQEVAVHRDRLLGPALSDLPVSQTVVRCSHTAPSCSMAMSSDGFSLHYCLGTPKTPEVHA